MPSIINHPDLFEEFGENFVGAEFQTVEYERLRQTLAETLSQAGDALPTSEELQTAHDGYERKRFLFRNAARVS